MTTSNKPYDYLIVGAGLFGAVFAQQAHQAGKRCLVVDKRAHPGGNIYCREEDGINVHLYGAHIFHTHHTHVWQYVNGFVPFNRYTNSPLASYQGKLYNLPFNMNTFYALWGVTTPAQAQQKIESQRAAYAHITTPANLEEQALKLCGDDIYRILIKGYTEKQWGRPATELPPFIIQRVPLRFTFDNNYFNDPYQGIPIGGYNVLIQALLQHAEVRLNTDYFEHRSELDRMATCTLFTGCIDQYFDYCYGHLEYRSLRFDHVYMPMADFQGNAVVNHTHAEVPYTRTIEHKHFEFGQQPHTIVTYEYPDSYAPGKEPYYPINNDRNNTIYRQYAQRAATCPNLLIGGRLGHYAYADMDDTIHAALQLAQQVLH